MTTPADELRAAAALLRDKATEAIHEGRTTWSTGNTLGSRSPVVVDDQEQPSVLIETFAARLERVNSYLALVGPATGLAVAAWLDAAAVGYDATVIGAAGVWTDPADAAERDAWVARQTDQHALAVARQVLGTPTTDTAPALEPQDHPGADLFVALQAAGLDADEAHRRMYAYAGMVLRQEKATASAPAAPADRATDRRDRYAAAIRDNDGWVLDGGQHMLDAVMAVADAEQAVLASTLREVLDTFGPMHDVYGGPVSYYDGSADITPAQYEGWRAVLDGVPRRLADEAQPETEGFREWLRRQPVGDQPITLMAPVPLTLAPDATATTEDDDPICGDQYDGEACELEPEHPGAHCAGIACWDYGRAPATAATEEPQP